MSNTIKGLMRTHNCNELNKNDLGKNVTLCGWVNKSRNLGGLYFIDIRDKFGVTQLNFSEFKGDLIVLKDASLESVIWAKGVVSLRPSDALNKNMETGEIEVKVLDFKILSIADKDHIPFLPYGAIEANEDLRLKYRYLDLRTQKLQKMLALRSQTSFKAREFLISEGFVEVETPVLYKSTPEGARDYIVPSRVHPGKVYALPQSPQTLKQLLMIGGTDKYFQITKCFRDEDLRADRQPEFTQVDIEVSFPTMEYMKNLSEAFLRKIFSLRADFVLKPMSFYEAMDTYGCDKPDTRFGLEQINATDLFKDSEFATFKTIAESGGLVKAMFFSDAIGQMSRKDIDELVEVVKPYGGKGVATFKAAGGNFSGGISKFITHDIYKALSKKEENRADGLWLLCADSKHEVAHACADAVRRHLGKKFKMVKDGYHFLWIYDFPLLEWSAEEERFAARHHPFTMPKREEIEKFMKGDHDYLTHCKAEAYDVVCNGYEIGGGSIRIFDQAVQAQMFKVLGLSEEETKKQFGFFIEALKYGTPPHGGIAFGLDRLMMLLGGTDNIRDVIAFPKTASASDLMSGSPSSPNPAQLKELHFNWSK